MTAKKQAVPPPDLPPIPQLFLAPRWGQTDPNASINGMLDDDDDLSASRSKSQSVRSAQTEEHPFNAVDVLVRLLWNKTVEDLDWTTLEGDCAIVAVATPVDIWTDLVHRLLSRTPSNVDVVKISKPRDWDTVRTDFLPKCRPIVLVTHELDSMSHALRASLDGTVTLARVDENIIADVIRRASKRRVPKKSLMRLQRALHLDPYDFAGLVRRGRSVDAILAAFDRATSPTQSHGAIPDLAQSTAFGAAGTWGLQLAVDLRAWRRGEITWNEVDRGCVLWGPPGTGKTLFAKSLAAHCGIPIIVSSVGALFTTGDSHLGSVVRAIRKVFAEASSQTPSILFFDEVDALPSREKLDANGSQWWSTVITEFLTQLDGAISDRTGVITIAATNVFGAVDPALMRPGRLERTVFLGPPDARGLVDVLRHHLKNDLADINLTSLSEEAVGLTPADAMAAVRDARRIARTAKRPLEIADLRAVLHVNELPPAVRWRVALHECGHALIAQKIGWTVSKIVVGGGGASSGHTVSFPSTAREGTKTELLDRIRFYLAGRAAEEVELGYPSAGAGVSETSDLAQATEIAMQMELVSGLGKHLTFVKTPNSEHYGAVLTLPPSFIQF